MSQIVRSTLAGAAVAILGLSFANATTYWISTTGSDGAAGTSPSTAFATFGKADSVIVPGDTVRVLQGTYSTDRLHLRRWQFRRAHHLDFGHAMGSEDRWQH